MTFKEKMKQAEEKGVCLPNDLENKKVGIYKFFKVKPNEEKHCFYIGKSTDILYRLLGSGNGHIYMFLNNNFSKLVPIKINEYISEGYRIEVEIIDVDYNDSSFTRAAHRLALVEIQEIVKYQKIGQCEFQMPEGVGMYEEKFWEENYKLKTDVPAISNTVN
jgi:hypothetical protein